MPDPRSIYVGGEVLLGYNDGTTQVFDEYGRRPWQADYRKETRELSEEASLDRFKGEFARLYGPYRRGRDFELLNLGKERDDDEYHEHMLSLEGEGKRKMNRGS